MTVANPARPAFRPVKTVDEISWADFENRMELMEFTIHRGKAKKTYHVTPLSTDWAGVAVRVGKVGGDESYDLMLGEASVTSCSCPGFCWTGGCCHLAAVQMLVEAGVLHPAADPAAGECDEEDCPF